MIWAKIKKAINSTLGTKNFKPLDKIIEDGFVEVKEKQNAIGETADSTLDALENGENEFSVKFANFVTSLFAQKLEFENPDAEKDERYVDLAKAGSGLYMIRIRDTEEYNDYVAFMYHHGLSTKSITVYSTPFNGYSDGKAAIGGRLYQGTDESMQVYKINISFNQEA